MAQNTDGVINSITPHGIANDANSGNYLDGYLSDLYFIDGTALTPSTFGQFSAQNSSVWVLKTPTGLTYGTNGGHYEFDNASALGTDTSGNGNNYTSSGLTTGDQMLDTPTNNYCVLNSVFTPLGSLVKATYAEGNLKHIGSTGGYADSEGTFAIPSSGKWYFEAKYLDNNKGFVGIHAFIGTVEYAYMYRGSSGVLYRYDGTTDQSTGITVTTNDIVAVAIDADGGTISWYKNNTQIGTSVSLSSWGGRSWFPFCEDDSSGAASNILFNFGSNGFAYTPPTGFKSLCTSNMTTPLATITTSGTFTGKANADGPFVYTRGTPQTLTINSNAVTWGTHADKLANGFKLRTASASYNASGSNTWTATATSDMRFPLNNAQGNP